jgi:hypothetical protein
MSLLVQDDTCTVKLPLPEGGGVNFCVDAGSLLRDVREGAGVGVIVGVVAADVDGSRLGSGVGVASPAGGVVP